MLSHRTRTLRRVLGNTEASASNIHALSTLGTGVIGNLEAFDSAEHASHCRLTVFNPQFEGFERFALIASALTRTLSPFHWVGDTLDTLGSFGGGAVFSISSDRMLAVTVLFPPLRVEPKVVSVLAHGEISAVSARRAECPIRWSPARA